MKPDELLTSEVTVGQARSHANDRDGHVLGMLLAWNNEIHQTKHCDDLQLDTADPGRRHMGNKPFTPLHNVKWLAPLPVKFTEPDAWQLVTIKCRAASAPPPYSRRMLLH